MVYQEKELAEAYNELSPQSLTVFNKGLWSYFAGYANEEALSHNNNLFLSSIKRIDPRELSEESLEKLKETHSLLSLIKAPSEELSEIQEEIDDVFKRLNVLPKNRFSKIEFRVQPNSTKRGLISKIYQEEKEKFLNQGTDIINKKLEDKIRALVKLDLQEKILLGRDLESIDLDYIDYVTDNDDMRLLKDLAASSRKEEE
jgi:hypothetical protein